MELAVLVCAVLVIVGLVALLVRQGLSGRIKNLETLQVSDSAMMVQLRKDFDERDAILGRMVEKAVGRAIQPVLSRLDNQDALLTEIRDAVEPLVNRGIDDPPPPPPSPIGAGPLQS